jgi:nucleoside-diphosphate-sugar epimerase
MKFTVFGGSGFVGGSLTRALVANGHDVQVPSRPVEPLVDGHSLGHVIYAIGLTADFRHRTPEAIEAHAHLLARLLQGSSFDSWLYLSSTRVYGCSVNDEQVDEYSPIRITPSADAIYDLSKLLGESVCLAHPSPTVRVARLSNVYGTGQSPGNFLGSVIRSVCERGRVLVGEAPESSKDYVCVSDVVGVLPLISMFGRERLYNLACGRQTTHRQLAAIVARCSSGVVDFAPNPKIRKFPTISVQRLASEFGYDPVSPEAGISSLLSRSQEIKYDRRHI